jgi:hypothetical protein
MNAYPPSSTSTDDRSSYPPSHHSNDNGFADNFADVLRPASRKRKASLLGEEPEYSDRRLQSPAQAAAQSLIDGNPAKLANGQFSELKRITVPFFR